MNDLILIILGISLIFYFVISSNTLYSEISYVKSDLDNNKYIIRRGNIKSKEYLKESANTLAEINIRVIKLIDHLKIKYNMDMNKNYFINKLKDKYRHDILSEAANDNRYTTYTIDKKDMYVCLRHRDKSEKIYDINLLMYVILHELAHLCNFDRRGNAIIGHGIEFKNIFKLFIIESININIYKYENYFQTPKEYCGMMVSTTILPEDEYEYYSNLNSK